MARICLVTPAHPTSNPRLVKEADALHAAGHAVHVVHGRYFPPLDCFDAALLADVPWSRGVVDYTGGSVRFVGRILRAWARRRLAAGANATLGRSLRAHHIAIPALAQAAARRPADLYIGHTLAGLAAAGLAARRTGARLGFDAEDFHSAETETAENDPAEAASIRRIEAEFLPRCAHLSAASPLIGRAYAETYGVRSPVVVLNTFPLREGPPAPTPPERPGGRPLLYWFSQTIGPGRGLELLVESLGRLRAPCALRLRGLPAAGFPDALRSIARQKGFQGPIEFTDIAPPAEMARLAAAADLGLSLEQRTPRNRDLCLTNKIFTYLLAGVPVALSPTAAQNALAPGLGEAALLFSGEPEADAARLDQLLADPARLERARAAAWRLGRERYHWEHERVGLVNAVSSALSA